MTSPATGLVTGTATRPTELLAHLDAARLWPSAAPEADMAQAYQTALQVRALREARGEQPRGYKIGFTNRSIWPRYNVFAPIWGTVWDSTLSHDPAVNVNVNVNVTAMVTATATPLSLARICQPRIEPELVFGLRATPAPDATLDELFDALDWLAPGFEIVQSHRPDWRFTAVDTVADSGLHAHLRVGQRVPVRNCAANAAELDPWLATARVKLFKSNPDAGPEVGRQAERLIDEGSGANVLDSPLRALQYFVRELAQCPGATALQPGDVVTTGTWTDAWPVQPGECWTARFSAMGAVAVPGLQMAFS